MSLFEQLLNLKQSPKVVVKDCNNDYSGRQLLEKVGKIQNVLLHLGVKNGDKIPVIVEPSIDAIALVYAIGFLGAVYVPISPKSPKKRINFIIKDLSAKLVLTNQNYLLIDNNINMFTIKDLLSMTIKDKTPTVMSRRQNDTAYIIYTSGSTGNPKGVEVSFDNLESFIHSFNICFPSSQNSTYLLNTALQFDVSISELYGWISQGAVLQLLSAEQLKDLKNLPLYVKKYHITHLCAAPSTLQVMDNSRLDLLDESSLSFLLIAGEEFPVSLAKRLKKLVKSGKVYNCYGPTEATVYALYHKVTMKDILQGKIPIGRPFPNATIKLLPQKRKNFELLIGGYGVSKGYLNLKRKNSYSFVELDGERFYKTGDLVKYDQDMNNIIFVGRKDFQLEINSIRVEPSEIEGVINQVDKVIDSLVVMNKGILTCIYTTFKHSIVDSNSIKLKISEKLPKYMIPKRWYRVSEFPLTINGKIDRKTLLKTFSNPINNSDTEDKLISKIEQICDISNLSENDNIFDLGIDSLMTVEIEIMLEKHYHSKIPTGFLYEHPTVEKIKRYFKDESKLKFNNIEQILKKITERYVIDKDKLIIYSNDKNVENKLQKHLYNLSLFKEIKINDISIFNNENNCETVVDGGKINEDRNYESSIFQKVYTTIKLPSFTVVRFSIQDDLVGSKTKTLITRLIYTTEAFRTKIIKTTDGNYISTVYTDINIRSNIEDITYLSKEKQVNYINKKIGKYENQILSKLTRNYLYKILSFRTSSQNIELVIICHHNICDGASEQLLNKKIGQLLNNQSVTDLKMKDYLETIKMNSAIESILNDPVIKEIGKMKNQIGNEKLTWSEKRLVGVEKLNNFQKMMMVANYVTKEYLKESGHQFMTFQMLFNFRKVNNKDFSTLINDCHETLTFFRRKSDTDIQFVNNLFYRLNDFHYNRGISTGYAIYNNFPAFNNEQLQIQKILEEAPINIDYIGEVETKNLDSKAKAIINLRKQLKDLKHQIRFTAFSSKNEMFIYRISGEQTWQY